MIWHCGEDDANCHHTTRHVGQAVGLDCCGTPPATVPTVITSTSTTTTTTTTTTTRVSHLHTLQEHGRQRLRFAAELVVLAHVVPRPPPLHQLPHSPLRLRVLHNASTARASATT